jgi:hypothetical protein
MEEREQYLLDAVFGTGPNPQRLKMAPDQVLREWIESTEDAIYTLRRWVYVLREWKHNSGQKGQPGELDAALRVLADQGLDCWADGNPAGGGIDRLAEVVTGREP